MAKPVVMRINPFDATKDYEITLSWLGNRAHANRIVIYNNETNNVIFDDTVSSFALTHIIPAYTLENNKKYVIEAQTFDIENIPSVMSNKVLFFTFATPDFYFEGLRENSIIDNSSFTASVHYYSEDWEDISKYKFYLYDASKKQLLESKEMHDDLNISYTYKGLDNNTVYYIRCVGVTVNGMEIDTGYTKVTVKFENPNDYARIYATSIPSQGCIQISSNLIIIQYNGTDEFEYINGMIDLREKTLYYDEGFLIEKDFTTIIRGINLWQTADILKMSNSEYGLTLSSRIYNNGKLRFRLMVPNAINNYLLYSDFLVFENTDMVNIMIRRKNDVYQIRVFIELGFSTESGNLWLGRERPPQRLMENNDIWINTDEETHMINKEDFKKYFCVEEPIDAEVNDWWIGGLEVK